MKGFAVTMKLYSCFEDQSHAQAMMNSAFNDQILAEKLKKLNNSQQSIETLSHWCIFHRKKAHLVVETWDKQLRVLPKEQRVPFLYLANDILQNSRRRGVEFVTEFWRILPGALKDVIEKGDDQAHNVVFRLVDIWDERKVFGLRAKSLREELLGADPPTDLSEQHLKFNHNAKIKVAASGMQEKLITAYRSVQSTASEEDVTLGRCNAAVIRMEGLEKEADELQDKSILTDELQEQEDVVFQCVGQLESSESARMALVSLLKEALREQESKLELIRSQVQNAKAQAHHSSILRQQFLAHSSPATSAEAVQQLAPVENKLDSKSGSYMSLGTDAAYQWPPLPPTEELNSFVDEFKNTPSVATSAAAEVAAKLAASSSSAQVLASVLSSMVAEEASNTRTANAPLETPPNSNFSEKRQRVDEETDYVRNPENSSAYAHQPPPPPLPLQNMGPQYYGSGQLYSSSPPQGQQPHYPPLPPGLPQHSNVNTPVFGYTGVLPRPPLHPPMQGQLPMNTLPTLPNVQVFNSGPFPPLRPPGIGFFDQQSLPAAHLPRH